MADDSTRAEICMENSSQQAGDNTENSVANSETPDKSLTENTEQTESISSATFMNSVMCALKGLDKKIDGIDKTTKEMKASFELRLQNLESTATTNKKKVGDIEDSLNYVHKEVADLKESVTQLKKENKELREKVNNAQKQSKETVKKADAVRDEMVSRLNDLERRTRDYSIRVRGIPEELVKEREDHRKLIAQVLIENRLVPTDDAPSVVNEMEIAHPLVPAINGKRNFIARFFSRPYRERVIRAAKGKTAFVQAEKVTEDMTKLDRDLKTKAFPQMQKAYQEGKRVKFQKGKLYIQGKETPIINS